MTQIALFVESEADTRASEVPAAIEQLAAECFDVKKFAANFPVIADGGGTKRLRELVLELAIRGRLVSPAAPIALEFTLTQDHGVNPGRDQPDTAPFRIPDHWTWANVGKVAKFFGGFTFKSADFGTEGIGVVRMSDLQGELLSPEGMVRVAPRFIDELGSDYQVPPGSLVMGMSGSVGKLGFNRTTDTFLLNQRVCRLEPVLVEPRFLYYVLKRAAATYLSISVGSAIANLSVGQVKNTPVPLPPLAEQKRIVARVDQLMALIDDLEARQTKKRDLSSRFTKASLEALTTAESPEAFDAAWQRVLEHFPTVIDRAEKVVDLRNAVLEMAFTGRLVQRLDSDSAVAALVAAMDVGWSKRRRKEVLSAVEPDEVRVGPSHWTWVRLGNLAEVVGGVTKGRDLKGRKCISLPYLRVANVQRGFLDLAQMKEIEVADDELPKYRLLAGDVLFTEGGDWDKLGRSTVWANEIDPCIHQNHVFRARLVCSELDPAWVSSFANSPVGRRYFEGAAKRTTNLASINMRQLRHCPIPVPPAEEKARIVAKVDQLMKLCDDLEAKLHRAEDRASKLVEAVVQEMVA